ncbi:MAG TPA: hypothetical protein VGP07_19635 [Polyangia bacterium]|jgi:hypothetical protein
MAGDLTTALTDQSARQPSRRKLALIRLGFMVAFIIFSPVLFALSLRSRPQGSTGFAALDARVREIWKTSAHDAVDLLKSTFDQLIAKGAFGIKAIEIEPFGKFEPWDVLRFERHLYNCEIALGRYEDAMAVAASMPGRLEEFILQQVDCLVALGRGLDAIALLERNLDTDGWRGTLRRRLRELGGRDLRSVN